MDFEKDYQNENKLEKNFFRSTKKKNSNSSLKNDKYKSKNFENIKKWLSFSTNRDLIKHRFFCFLLSVFDEKLGSNFYLHKIYESFFFNKKFFLISFLHLVIIDPLLAIWIVDEPLLIFEIFEDSIREIFNDIFQKAFSLRYNVLIKILELPMLDTLKNLKNYKINALVKIRGIVVSKTNIYPFLKFFKLTCLKCFEHQKTIYSLKNKKNIDITNCFNCKGNGPFQINWTHYENYNFQKIFIQELSIFNSFVNILFAKEIILKNDLIDSVNLGEEIEITGVLKYNYSTITKNLFNSRLFSTNIEANNIEKKKSLFDLSFNSDEEMILYNIFKKKTILLNLLNSFLPSIFDQNNFKMPLLLCFFGGQTKKISSEFHARKNINILIIGDPATGKSNILKAIECYLPKSIFITGREINKKSLISTFKFEKATNNWVIEGGVLVFSDKGFCLIDEIEKLKSTDIVYLNDAMEKQHISIEIKELRDSLKTRFSIIATTSPLNGYYQSKVSIIDNIQLNENFLTNFDIYLILQDKIDGSNDEALGKFIIKSHRNYHPLKFHKKKKIISIKLFKKYIIYERNSIKPKFNKIHQEKIIGLYSSIRKENFSSRGFKLGLKHLESIFRLIEASSRLYLREKASKKDVTLAIAVFLKSFFYSQPIEVQKFLNKKYKKFIRPIENFNEFCFDILLNFFTKNSRFLPNLKLCQVNFEKKIKNMNIKKKFLKTFYKSKYFLDYGFKLDANKKIIFFFK